MSIHILLGLLFVLIFSSTIDGQALEEGCYNLRTNGGAFIKPRVISVTGQGTLLSPGYKENKTYPDDVYCAYQLQASGWGMHVRLHFNDLDIDSTEACGADSLTLYDFDIYGQGVLVGMLCSNQIPNDYVSNSSAFQIVLKTDGFAGRRGFNITYSIQSSSGVCSLGRRQCRNRNCVDFLDVCNGKDDCGDGTDEENCRAVLPVSECGRPEIDPVTFADFDRIVGGQEAVYGSWPWMADLQMNFISPNGHVCGGALLNAQWVLTAAHCVMDPSLYRDTKNMRIHIGNFRKFDKDQGEQVRYAQRIVIYDDMTPEELGDNLDLNNDMALIKLNAPVKFNKYVKPVCLPDPGIKLNITSKCYATGWGTTRGSGSSDRLKQAYHPIQDGRMCSRLVGNQFNNNTMICAGSMGPLNGVCHGDSGGPLACETSKGQWSIVGVASYVTDGTGDGNGLCGLKGRPSVFNKVPVKIAWIRKIINRYS